MGLYDDMQAVAREVLTDPDFNQGIIKYIGITPGAGPVDDPGPSTPTPFTLAGAVASGVWMKYVNMNLAVATDLQVVMSVDTRFTPDMTDMVDIEKPPGSGTFKRHKIVSVIQTPAAGTPVTYTLIVRAGG